MKRSIAHWLSIVALALSTLALGMALGRNGCAGPVVQEKDQS